MKKIVACVILVALMIVLAGCESAVVTKQEILNEELNTNTTFVKVASYKMIGDIVYDKETKVMYWISMGGYNGGTLTLLVNPDGIPRLWEGE